MITKDKIIIKQKGDQLRSYKGGFMDNNLKNIFALPDELNIFYEMCWFKTEVST